VNLSADLPYWSPVFALASAFYNATAPHFTLYTTYGIIIGMDTENHLFTLDELARAVALPRRTVRYYIQIGLLDRPEGLGRGAHYAPHHLAKLQEIKKWKKAGLSLERIRELIDPEKLKILISPPEPQRKGTVEVWSHVVIDEGIEITLNPTRLNMTPEQVREFASAVADHYEKFIQKKEMEP